MPGLILVSAGTTVLATGVNAVKGPKGAGDIQPSLSDFFTAGGLVTAERLQFFVWTLLGVISFLFMIVFSEACHFQELPAIPANFLALMGISSAGYLGGKLARKPGPVIDSIVIASQDANNKLTLKISGAALSRDASFKVDDKGVKPHQTPGQDPRPIVIAEEDDFRTSGFAKILQLTISSPPNVWLPTALSQKDHTLTIINPDGKMAVWPFETALT